MTNKITSTSANLAGQSLEALSQELKESLSLDLSDFGLEVNEIGEYTSQFVGVHLNSAFQPIYNVSSGDLQGYEALLRPILIASAQATKPEFAFSYAQASNNLVKLDRISRALHLLNYQQIFQEKGLLFLNVHPSLLISVNEHGKVFERILHANSVPTDRVVIELRDFVTPSPEDSLLGYERKLASAIDNYHDRGYKIAIDNFGNQHSLVSRLWKLTPDFIKLDQALIRQAEDNPRLAKTLLGLVRIIKDIGAEPIITGIETQVQLDIALQTGASLIQGYLLGEPASVKNLQSSNLVKRL